jgi:putative ABC transport system permease protein
MNNIRLIQGHAPNAPDEIVIDETKAARNHPVGSTLKVFGPSLYRVAGIYAPESGARVKMSLKALEDALEAPGKCTFIYVKVKNPSEQIAVARRIDAAFPGNKIQPTRDLFASIETSIPGLNIFMRVLVGWPLCQRAGGDAGNAHHYRADPRLASQSHGARERTSSARLSAKRCSSVSWV